MEEIILRYLRQSATTDEKEHLLAWLRESDEHRRQFMELRDVCLASGEIMSKIDTPIEAYTKFRWRTHRLFIPIGRVAAAVLLLLVTFGGAYQLGLRHSTGQSTAVTIRNCYAMGDHSKGSITLPDGSVVWLNGKSRLTYPQTFAADKREVTLEGEGYFKVAKNAQIPFLVKTGDISVRVTGTRFNLKSYPSKNTSEVVLISGGVKVTLPDKEEVTLTPNRRMVWNKSTQRYRVSEVPAEESIVWTQDRLDFRDELLSTILRKMEYWYDIRIQCAKGVNLNQCLSLKIQYESKEEIFKLLSEIASFSYDITGDTVIVYSHPTPRRIK
jgi:ferric-dicitrate binding protein FerR (iron transport regulator)